MIYPVPLKELRITLDSFAMRAYQFLRKCLFYLVLWVNVAKLHSFFKFQRIMISQNKSSENGLCVTEMFYIIILHIYF